MIVRTALPSDYPAIAGGMDAWCDRASRGALPRLFLDHFWPYSLVAQDGGLAGFLVGFASPAIAEEAYIHCVAVAPDHRRHGLGRRLYEQFFDVALVDGRFAVSAVAVPSDTASIGFHRSLGFAVSDPVPDYDGPGRTRVVMTRRLG